MIKNDISTINWSKGLGEIPSGVKIKEHIGVPSYANWVLPQLAALFNKVVVLKRSSSGLVSFQETFTTLRKALGSGSIYFESGSTISLEEFRGILRFLNHAPRGDIMPSGVSQSSSVGVRYGTGVPLILSFFKEFRNVGYMEWDWSEDSKYINIFVDRDFAKIVPLIRDKWVCPWNTTELLEFTETASIYKSGSKSGQCRTLSQMTSFNKIGNEFDDLDNVPAWFKPMLCQTWLFQPHIISKYAINNVLDLDNQVASIRGDLNLLVNSSSEDSVWD